MEREGQRSGSPSVAGYPLGHVGALCSSPPPAQHFSSPPSPLSPLLSEPHLAPFRTPAVEKNKEEEETRAPPREGSAGWLSFSHPSSLWHLLVCLLSTQSPPGGKALSLAVIQTLTQSPHASLSSRTGSTGCVGINSFNPQNSPMK